MSSTNFQKQNRQRQDIRDIIRVLTYYTAYTLYHFFQKQKVLCVCACTRCCIMTTYYIMRSKMKRTFFRISLVNLLYLIVVYRSLIIVCFNLNSSLSLRLHSIYTNTSTPYTQREIGDLESAMK